MYRPEQNWQPASSFVEPVAPPDAAPGDAPGVAVCFNEEWLPFVIGGLMQLCQPTTWDISDPTAMQDHLDRVQELLQMFGVAEGCMELRWSPDDCAIEQSTDNGATWAAISGWDLTSVQGCVMAGLSIRVDASGNLQFSIDGGVTWTTTTDWGPTPPPNPGAVGTSDQACNIATHLTLNIIQGALKDAVDSFNASIAEAAAAASILALIPVFGPEVALTIDAAAGIAYLIYHTGSIGDYETASTDFILSAELQCAIYSAIVSDGQVTAANFASVASAIHAIGYSPSDVQDAIDNFVSSLGANGMMAAQQLGNMVDGNCTGCGSGGWCFTFDFTVSNGGWSAINADTTYVAGVGWQSHLVSSTQIAWIHLGFTSTPISSVEVFFNAISPAGGGAREVEDFVSGHNYGNLPTGAGTFNTTVSPIATTDNLQITVVSNGGGAGANTITKLVIRGTGSCPFGTPNCL